MEREYIDSLKYDFSKIKFWLDKKGKLLFDIRDGSPPEFKNPDYIPELRIAILNGFIDPAMIEDAATFAGE